MLFSNLSVNEQEMLTVMDLQLMPGRQDNQWALTEMCSLYFY